MDDERIEDQPGDDDPGNVSIEKLMYIADMTILSQSFPSLREAMGRRPFDPAEMERIVGESADPAAKAAAKLMLDLWETHHPERKSRFDLIEAMAVWDADHRGAFDAWFNGDNYPLNLPDPKLRFQTRPRPWTAQEALSMLREYIESFNDRNSARKHKAYES